MTALAIDSIVSIMQTATTSAATHEVRVGMSVYWVRTWPAADGTGWWLWSSGDSRGTAATQRDCVLDARACLRQLETEARVSA